MQTKHRNETERLIWEREITDKFFEGEMPVTETITERTIEHEPTVYERAEEELKIAETEHRGRSDPPAEIGIEIENDYEEHADKEFYEEYDRKVNHEQPTRQAETHRSETPSSKPSIEDRMEGEIQPQEVETEPEAPQEIQTESIDELVSETEIEIPETDIELSDESDEVGPEIEWDIDIDYDGDQDPDYDYEY